MCLHINKYKIRLSKILFLKMGLGKNKTYVT